ncbi:hypothetical protein ROHU_034002 [Labeo rohita]|uniref:Uncharacterized protein n=1 Tax=Labeo rohita TaxID=84645 RepID=A0A498L8G1_LABRO|nr:hypothetical protein ROHU_034002 [Labeo rohita]
MGGLSQQLLGDQDSRRCTRRGEETWSLAHQARREKGKPAWEGSRGNCWEIKTPALHQAGKRDGVWPAGKRGRKANPPGRALAATDGRSRLQRCTRRGKETWSLAPRARKEKGEPAWEGSCGN